MTTVLALLASGRKKGFTASLLQAAIEGAEGVEGVEVKRVHLHNHRFGPCTSCFNCIRDPAHECTLADAMGGRGELTGMIRHANGWILADPVHCWGTSAICHLFIERCYPFLWSGTLEGLPFASISCASNQGMQRLANANLCKWAFTYGFRYVGGLPVHTVHMEQAQQRARDLGRRLAEAAQVDAGGRRKFPDLERYVDYLDKPWSALEPYLQNLSDGTMGFASSLVAQGLASFGHPEAIDLLHESEGHLRNALSLYKEGRHRAACEELVRSSALWTHATWQEFLEEKVIRTGTPTAYRPIVEEGRSS